MTDALTPLQREVLAVLAPVRPRWTLTGGAALAGFHLGHRTTRDLDLFWHDRTAIAEEAAACQARLEAAGLQVEALQRSPGFVRLRTSRGQDSLVVDIVAEPVPASAPAVPKETAGGEILVDALPEILANKLGCLLHRAELRDLVDLQAILARGLDLETALRAAAAKDGGFSPLMVAHLLHEFPIERQARQLGMAPERVAELSAYRTELAARIAAAARPA